MLYKCESTIIMGDFNCRLDQNAHENHMNVISRFTGSVETTENGMSL